MWRDSNELRGFVPLLAHKHYIEHLSNSSYRFRGKLYHDNYRYRIIAQPYVRCMLILSDNVAIINESDSWLTCINGLCLVTI